MGAPISTDLRTRVVAAYKAGRGTYREIAELFGVGEASVDRWLRLDRAARRRKSSKGSAWAISKLDSSCDREGRQDRCRNPRKWERLEGVSLRRSAMQRALFKAAFTWRKRLRPSEQQRANVQEEPAAFRQRLRKTQLERLIVIDESRCNLAMSLAYRRALRGERVIDHKLADRAATSR